MQIHTDSDADTDVLIIIFTLHNSTHCCQLLTGTEQLSSRDRKLILFFYVNLSLLAKATGKDHIEHMQILLFISWVLSGLYILGALWSLYPGSSLVFIAWVLSALYILVQIQIKCIYIALLTSTDVSNCYTETQPKTPNSKQCRCRSMVARKNSLESGFLFALYSMSPHWSLYPGSSLVFIAWVLFTLYSLDPLWST